MVLRLTESDLKNLISSSVNKILRENIENGELLSLIISRMTDMQNEIDWSQEQGDLEIPLDDDGNNIAFILYHIDNNMQAVPGQISRDIDVPDDPDNIEGDYNVIVDDIVIYDENNNETNIQDNGMVANAIKSLIDVEPGEYYQDDDQSGYNDSWR